MINMKETPPPRNKKTAEIYLLKLKLKTLKNYFFQIQKIFDYNCAKMQYLALQWINWVKG
jgi:hypothetical protein